MKKQPENAAHCEGLQLITLILVCMFKHCTLESFDSKLSTAMRKGVTVIFRSCPRKNGQRRPESRLGIEENSLNNEEQAIKFSAIAQRRPLPAK